MANPNVPLGQLNRLKASVVWRDFPALNITASFLGKGGIRPSPASEATTYILTMTGGVPSPEPYQVFNLSIALLKTQALADAYKKQLEFNALLGNCTLRPDIQGNGGLSPYLLKNCSIVNVGAMAWDGSEAVYPIDIRGFYAINAGLWG